MPKLVCPVCGTEIILAPEEVLIYSTLQCDECGVAIEIVNEDPPEIAVLAEEDDEYDEEDDDL